MTAKKAPAKEAPKAEVVPKVEDKPEPLTVEEIRERRKAAFADGTADRPPTHDGNGDAIVPEGGFSLRDAEQPEGEIVESLAPRENADPDDPYANLSRADLISQLVSAKGRSKIEPPSRRACLIYAPRGNSRFYLDGRVATSWDKGEPEAHIWRQIEIKCRTTGETQVDVVHWPHKILPDTLPPEKDLGVRATPNLSDVVKHETRKPGPATTSYATGMGPTESL